MWRNKHTQLKSYLFKIVIEKDEDVYHAYCPALKGASTWGYTKEEAIRNIQEVIQMVVESMMEHGELTRSMHSKTLPFS